MYYVYGLHDPVTNELCYVGVTNNLERRKKEHMELSGFAFHYYSSLWQDRMRTRNKIVMHVISEFPNKKEAYQQEKELIHYLAEIRHPLVNDRHYLSHNRYSNITLKETFEATQWFIDEMRGAK